MTTLKAFRLNFFLQESPFAITINCKMAARNQTVKHATDENDDKLCDLEETIHELDIKLKTVKKELSEVMENKNSILADFRDVTDTRNNEKDEHELETKQFQSKKMKN